MTKKIEHICINCRYRRFAGFKGLPDKTTMKMGRCHHSPPNIEGQFPLVKPFDHCSKFKKIKRSTLKRQEEEYYKMPQ